MLRKSARNFSEYAAAVAARQAHHSIPPAAQHAAFQKSKVTDSFESVSNNSHKHTGLFRNADPFVPCSSSTSSAISTRQQPPWMRNIEKLKELNLSQTTKNKNVQNVPKSEHNNASSSSSQKNKRGHKTMELENSSSHTTNMRSSPSSKARILALKQFLGGKDSTKQDQKLDELPFDDLVTIVHSFASERFPDHELFCKISKQAVK